MLDPRTAPYAALINRVTLGIVLLAHGLLLKVFTFGLAGTAGYFQSIGYPGFFAYLVILGEVGGGLALILGLWTRPISLLLLPILLGATLQHVANGWLFTAQGGGWEYPLVLVVMAVVQALLGDGPYAMKLGARSERLASAH